MKSKSIIINCSQPSNDELNKLLEDGYTIEPKQTVHLHETVLIVLTKYEEVK